MSETIITVQGHHSTWYHAERATVHVSVDIEGPDRAAVFSAATDGAATLTASLARLSEPEPGHVTWWSSDSTRVWSEKPWNSEGRQLDPVFHASIGVRAKFRDFDALSRWVEEAAEQDGVVISRIEWALTEATRTSATAEVRSRAVRDAADKARVFAQSIGLGQVTAIALADPGMLGDPGGPATPIGAGYERAMMKSVSADGGAALSFTPEDIAVEATVDARFIAR